VIDFQGGGEWTVEKVGEEGIFNYSGDRQEGAKKEGREDYGWERVGSLLYGSYAFSN
jgi:hypothetical protein